VQESHLPYFGFRVSRADVAGFMIQAVENHVSIHKILSKSP
jgi:hypothetical protein